MHRYRKKTVVKKSVNMVDRKDTSAILEKIQSLLKNDKKLEQFVNKATGRILRYQVFSAEKVSICIPYQRDAF
jgi:hypothetical protein